MIRTFHPIGQGGFVTERFTSFNMVYDCGSLTNNKILEEQINNAFYPDEKIDLLFISHFDADHINGIDLLKSRYKIKRVIIPLLTDKEIQLQIFVNENVYNFSNSIIVESPEEYFGSETNIIRVTPTGEDDTILEGTTDPTKLDKTIRSGRKIGIGNWCFVPFNFKFSERSPDLLKKLKLNKIKPENPNSILNKNDKIKEAYYSIRGKLNGNSMILISYGQGKDQNISQFSHRSHLRHPNFRRFDRFYLDESGLQGNGCLYFGDFNLRIDSAFRDIETRIKSIINSIGTIQIPHHGSFHNFDKRILFFNNPDYHLFSCIIQAGFHNRFGHPSPIVIHDIICTKNHLSVVTEEQETIVYQNIDGF